MEQYAGIDVSLAGNLQRLRGGQRGQSSPRGQGCERARRAVRLVPRSRWAVTQIGLEAGPLSQWLYAGLRARGGSERRPDNTRQCVRTRLSRGLIDTP